MKNEPVKKSYLVSGVFVFRVCDGGCLGAQIVCRAETPEWAGAIARALQRDDS